MLSFIIPSFLFAASLQMESSDLTWIKDITHHMEKVSRSCQSDARAIVEKATKATKNPQNCTIAQELATEGRESGRKSLKSKNGDSARYPQLLVFVSFSMPMATLKTLARDVNRVGGKLVLRGLVKGNLSAGRSSEGSFPETLIKLQELQEELIIDPTLFDAYQIEVVPTFVLREQPTENTEEKVKHDVLQGNVSLEFVLEQFAEKGDVKGPAQQLLQTLKDKR
jgi:type-F conjugative transfer system pilin assembly protein TrbC